MQINCSKYCLTSLGEDFLMFIKKTKSKNNTYLQIVHSFREEGKTKHRVLANLGCFENLENNPQIISLGKRLLQLAKVQFALPEDICELDRTVYGHIAYRKLWKKLKIDKILKMLIHNSKIKFNFTESVYLMIVEKLLNPVSKLQTFKNQDNYCGLNEHVQLNHFYRSLDILASKKNIIEETLFERQKDLFNMKVDVVFYDVTTFHFESVRADGLREFGYSKSGQSKEVQVVLGLLMDESGRPVGYDLFPGNLFEGKTLITALDKLKERFQIRKLIIVSDKGMNSNLNLWRIRNAGYDFIVSKSVRGGPQKLKDAALNQENYMNLEIEEKKIRYKILKDYEQIVMDEDEKKHTVKTKVLITWSKKRAEKNKKDRMRMIEKAKKFECGKSVTNKRGHRKYLETEGNTIVVGIDEEMIKKDEQWDGYYAIQTSKKNLNPEEILNAYHTLWKIEFCFRVMKSTMKTEPIFHWTANRIKGHFVLCFMAFLLERTMELTLQGKGVENTPEKIKKALNSMQLSRRKIENEEYYMKGKCEALGNKIFRALKIRQPKNITPIDELQLDV
jgi:transposase